MNVFQIGRDTIDLAEHVFNHGTIGQWSDNFIKRFQTTHGKDAINKISTQTGSAILSPLAVAGGIARGEGVMKTLNNVYGGLGKDESLKLANIAGSAFTASVGMRVVGGLTHDSAGNPDIAGIPFI